jgi:hypothetical protein
MQKNKITNRSSLGFLTLLIFFSGNPVQAQRSHLGVLAGFATATVGGSYIEGSSGRELGFHAVGVIDREFNDRWAFETGISWIQKGGKKLILSDHAASGETYGFQTSYLQIPLLIRAKFPISGGPWFIAPFAGIAIGANVGSKHKNGEAFEFEEEGSTANSPGGEPQTLELSVPLGSYLWIEFPGDSRFFFGLKYEVGLTNVYQAAADLDQSSYNKVLVPMFGFVVPLQ